METSILDTLRPPVTDRPRRVADPPAGTEFPVNDLAFDTGHRDAAPAAASNLGRLLAEQADVAGARAAYQLAIDTGHPDFAPWAAADLGAYLARQGDLAGARAAYQQAIDTGHHEAAAQARQALRELGQHDPQR